MVFVEISEAFLQESLAPLYPQHGRRVVSSIKPLFGSVNLGRGLVDASSGLVSESDFFEQCVSVFVFDAVVGNYDRRRGKPNSMVRDGDLFILDHEKALDFSLRSAFAPSLLDANWQPGEHLFSGIIGNAQAGDLAAECVEKYTCVTDELLQLWSDSIPQTWGVESFSREALNFLAELRSNTAVAIENLRRVLQ